MYFSRVLKVVLLLSLLALVFPLSSALGQISVGTAVFRDSSPGLSDMLVVELTNLPALSGEEVYEGWLVTDDGSDKLSVGVFAVGEGGSVSHTFTHPNHVNLASIYDKFVITVEPIDDPDPDNPSGVVPFSDIIPTAGMFHIRHLIYSWAGNPPYASGAHEGDPKGITVGLWEQTNVALTHATLAVNSGTLDGIKLHAQHVINIVEGAEGANFDISVGNPGDGFGVFNYAADARMHAEFIVAAVPSNITFVVFEPQVSESSDNVANWAGLARDNALSALESNSITTAQAHITNSQTLLERALNGWDADRDGKVEAILGEGGATQAQISAQNMGTFNPTVPTEPPKTGDISFSTFAMIALAAGAVLVVGGGVLFRHSRARA